MVKFTSFLLVVLLSSTLFANPQLHKHVTEEEKSNMVLSLGIGALLGVGLHKGAVKYSISSPIQATLHVANTLWTLGSVSGNPVFNELAVQSLMLASSAALAGTNTVQQIATKTPFIGDGLAKGAHLTQGIISGAIYGTARTYLTRFCDDHPQWNMPFCTN